MALKVENYNYTKELENKSSAQYQALRKTLPMRYDYFSSFHLSIPSLPFLFFLPGSSLFAILSNPSSLLFLLPLYSLPPFISSLLPLSFPSHLTFSLFLPSLSLPCVPFRPPLIVSPPNALPFLPPSHSLQSFLLASSFPGFLPSSPKSVRATYSTECLANRHSPHLSPRRWVQ